MGKTARQLPPELREEVTRLVEEELSRQLGPRMRENLRDVEETLRRVAKEQERFFRGMQELREFQEENARAIRKNRQAIDALRKLQEENARAIRELREAFLDQHRAFRQLCREVGRLSDVVGYGLEDIAKVVVPGYMSRHYGIDMGELRRRVFVVDGREVEVNLYGRGRKEGRELAVLGECKSRIRAADVRKFTKKMKPVEEKLKGRGLDILKFMLGYVLYPSGERQAEKSGVLLIGSYER
ncbi:MAG: hypothetical protein DRP99_05435 [Candidatus Latescibacterota bacterium]|nr:MAG: hypothetical protein DRP99_05435 [Candidatus Latescibacterota bacterium]